MHPIDINSEKFTCELPARASAAHEVAHNLEKLLYGWEKGGAWKKPLASGKMQKELAALLSGDTEEIESWADRLDPQHATSLWRCLSQ